MVQQTTTRIDGEPARTADTLVEIIGQTLLGMGAAATPEQAQRRAAITLAEALPAFAATLDAQAPAAKAELERCIDGVRMEIARRAKAARQAEATMGAPERPRPSAFEQEEAAQRLVAFGQTLLQDYAAATLDGLTEQAHTWTEIERTLSTLEFGVPASPLPRADLFAKLRRNVQHMLSAGEQTAIHAAMQAIKHHVDHAAVIRNAGAARNDASPF